jgi:hypothetical protein
MSDLDLSQISKFPTSPSNKQIMFNRDGTKSTFSSNNNKWYNTGNIINISNDQKSVLLDPKYKVLLDSMTNFPGAFGIVLNKPTNITMQGEVEIKSSSIDIECEETIDSTFDGRDVPDVGSIVNLKLSLKEEYLNNLCIDLKPPQGDPGRTGRIGQDGPDGYGNGPSGYDGEIGPNATKIMRIRNIIYQEVDVLSKKAIIDIELVDRGKGPFFKITESDRTLSDLDPATRFIVDPIIRNIEFTSDVVDSSCNFDGMRSWVITKEGDDPLPVDPFMLRLSDDDTEDSQTFSALRMSEYIRSVVDFYENEIIRLDKEWMEKSKLHIEEIDSEARAILSELANELAACESTIPATEFGIIFSRRPSSPNSPSTFSAPGNNKIGNINSSGKNWEVVV